MAVIKNQDIKKMTKELADKKIHELESILLELEGEGKREKLKPVKKTIARIKTHIRQLELFADAAKAAQKRKSR